MRDAGMLIVIAVILAFFAGLISVVREMNSANYRNRPEVILRRCKIELRAIYQELMRLPANRDVHELCQDIQRVERLVDDKMAGK